MKTMTQLLPLLIGLGMGTAPVQAADDWFPSKWGKDDTLGSVNEITDASILAASKLVKTGKRYALGQVSSRDNACLRRTHGANIHRLDRGTV